MGNKQTWVQAILAQTYPSLFLLGEFASCITHGWERSQEHCVTHSKLRTDKYHLGATVTSQHTEPIKRWKLTVDYEKWMTQQRGHSVSTWCTTGVNNRDQGFVLSGISCAVCCLWCYRPIHVMSVLVDQNNRITESDTLLPGESTTFQMHIW